MILSTQNFWTPAYQLVLDMPLKLASLSARDCWQKRPVYQRFRSCIKPFTLAKISVQSSGELWCNILCPATTAVQHQSAEWTANSCQEACIGILTCIARVVDLTALNVEGSNLRLAPFVHPSCCKGSGSWNIWATWNSISSERFETELKRSGEI